MAEEALADDIAACSDDEDEGIDGTADDAIEDGDGPLHHIDEHLMFRRFSGVAYGTSRPVFSQSIETESPALAPAEWKQSRAAEMSLLRDNHILPPKHPPSQKSQSLPARIYRKLFSTKLPVRDEEDPGTWTDAPDEESPLLAHGRHVASASDSQGGEDLHETWEHAVATGQLRTTWQRETKTLASYSAPLTVTFLLQYSINVASIFAVGRIGTTELGAVSRESPSPLCFPPLNPIDSSALTKVQYSSGQHDRCNHLLGALPGSSHQPRHALRPGLRLRPQASRRSPAPAYGLLPVLPHASCCYYLVVF